MNIQIVIISYLLGAIPFAYLLIKRQSGQDIRDLGSGSIGAMNAFETSNSKLIGVAVFILDALKGSLAVLLAQWISGGNMYTVSLACVFAVLGHNYSVFMGFKGGKGLATAVGTLALVSPIGILFWALMWVTSYFIVKKDIHIANVSASIMGPMLLLSAPDLALWKSQVMSYSRLWDYKTLYILLNIFIIIKHIDPIRKALDNSENVD